MDYLGKREVLTNTDLDRFVYIEKVLDIWVQLMKNRGKNKSVAFKIFAYTFVHCVYIYIYIYIYQLIHFFFGE